MMAYQSSEKKRMEENRRQADKEAAEKIEDARREVSPKSFNFCWSRCFRQRKLQKSLMSTEESKSSMFEWSRKIRWKRLGR